MTKPPDPIPYQDGEPVFLQVLRECGYPTTCLVLDHETYFDSDYSLKKLSTIEYIQDERFEDLGVASALWPSAGLSRSCPRLHWDKHPDPFYQSLQQNHGERLENLTVIMQNARFDASILAYRYGIYPKYIIDTKGLAAAYNARKKTNLKLLAERMGLPAKGDTMDFAGCSRRTRTHKPKGRSKEPVVVPPMGEDKEQALADYALHDAYLEWHVFMRLLPTLARPDLELPLMQHTLELFTKPKARIDFDYAAQIREELHNEIEESCEAIGVTPKEIASQKGFAAAMEDALPPGESVPMKYDKAGKQIPAISKTDPGREWLENHSSPKVRAVIKARSTVQSLRLHIKRLDNITNQANAAGGYAPIGLNFWGAHCVPGDHEVLTQDGWVRLDQWNGGWIAQWSPNWHVDFLPAVSNKFVNQEKMVKLDAPRVRGVFTEGHWLPGYTHRGFFHRYQAGERRQIEQLPLGGQVAKQPEKVWRTRLAVAIQADGHWCDSRSGRKLKFGFRKSRKIRRLSVILRRLHIPYDTRYDKSGTVRIIVRKKDLPEWLPYGRKHFVEWGFGLDSGTVCREVLHWDGCQNKHSKGWNFSSCDYGDCEWVQTHAALSGYSASVKQRRSNHPTWSDAWRVFISPCNNACIKQEHWSDGPPTEIVYCPTTQTGYFLCRYGDRIFVSGNTGRFSGVDKTNWQNLPARNKNETVNKIRGVLIPPAGHKFVIVDASQIEARVIDWLAGQHDSLEKWRQGVDQYCEIAAQATSQEVRKPTESDSPETAKRLKNLRNMGKVAKLGCGYWVGGSTLKQQCIDMFSLELSDKVAFDLVYTYRRTHYKVMRFGQQLESALISAVKYGKKSTLDCGISFQQEGQVTLMTLPDGHVMRYENVSVGPIQEREPISMPDPMKQGVSLHLYGGHLSENATQSVARHILGEVVVSCEDMGYPVVLHTHDEVVCIAPDDQVETALDRVLVLMATTPDWADGLPLDSEGQIAERYTK